MESFLARYRAELILAGLVVLALLFQGLIQSAHAAMYVSITGLTPKGLLGTLRFWLLAVPSFRQAQKAEGNLFCEVRRIQNYQCTLTAWLSRESMLDYLGSGSHLKAMKAFRHIATGKSLGYEASSVPPWNEAFERLVRDGRDH